MLIDGIDVHEPSILRARDLLAGTGLEQRVSFRNRDAADPALSGRFDLVTIFEALHDMAHPVDALRTLRGMLAAGRQVFVADERTAEQFSPSAGDIERIHYGFSVLHCLPVGMVGEDAGTGTVMRPETVRRYATDAGYTACEVLPIDDKFWRFYLLMP